MAIALLLKLFEHNQWANLQMLAMCSSLSDEHLDALPIATSTWSLRQALTHLVEAQEGYLSLLTLPPHERNRPSLPFRELEASARRSGDALLAIVRGAEPLDFERQLETTDGYTVLPRVVLLQVVNHATDHRRQVRMLLKALGLTPPDVDGWMFGEACGDLVSISAG